MNEEIVPPDAGTPPKKVCVACGDRSVKRGGKPTNKLPPMVREVYRLHDAGKDLAQIAIRTRIPVTKIEKMLEQRKPGE
jgi:hypothetical protein